MRRLILILCSLVFLAIHDSASASALGLQTKTERRHRRHRLHHRHKKKHQRNHHKASETKQKGFQNKFLTVDVALDNMPREVGEAFAQFQSSRDATKANTVVDQLNIVYEHALSQQDAMTPACEDKRFGMAHEVAIARAGLKDVEGHVTQLQSHQQSLQSGVDGNLAEVEALRQQYRAHKALCQKNKEDSEKMLATLQEDMPKAKNINEEALKTCTASSSPPALVECSLPSGEFVTTFKSQTLRTLIANCSGVTEKIIALNLDRAIRNSAASAAMFLQVQSQQLRGTTSKSSHRQTHRRTRGRHQVKSHTSPRIANSSVAGLVQKSSAHRNMPDSWCNDVATPPGCDVVSDTLATSLGNVEDLVRDLLSKSNNQEEHCRTSLDAYEGQVNELTRNADDGNVALGNAAAELSELASLRHERRKQVNDVNAEASREAATCGQQLHDFKTALCSARKLKKELGTLAGAGSFLGDCEVSDWVRGPCNATCGDAGVQTLTRAIIKSEGTTPKCPVLTFTRPCNRKPCPIDGKMGYWDEWSGCSRACGGGTRARHRKVLIQSHYGGEPTAETMQEQLCNVEPCDQDCVLADWTPWTNCSKLCNVGHKSRVRKELRSPLGQGGCPAEQSPERLQTAFCNRATCDKTLSGTTRKCTRALDVTFVLDVSGSVGSANTEKLKAFAKLVIDSLEFTTTGAQAGVVYFGGTATVGSALVAQSATALAGVQKVTFVKGSTNTAQALALTRGVFEDNGRATAHQVAIVLTDGMPESSFLTGVEVSRLKEEGARIFFVGIGKSVSKHVFRRWATYPWEENVMTVPTYSALNAKAVVNLLANICGEDLS